MSKPLAYSADHGIPSLALVLETRALAPYLAPLVQQPVQRLVDAHITILQHQRGSRCTIQIRAAQQAWVAKVYASERADVYDYMTQLVAHGMTASAMYSIPQPIGYIPDLQLLLMEKVAGTPAKDVFLLSELGPQLDAARRCAGWLAHFQQHAPHGGPVFDVQAHFATLECWTQQLATLGEPLTHKAQSLLAALQAAAPSLHALQPCARHSSYSHAQLVFANVRTVTFDWDGYGVADPAYDAARFTVALRRLALGRRSSLHALDLCAQHFCEQYAALAGATAVANMPFFEAALCLQLAWYDRQHQVPDWPLKIGALLDEGMRVLDTGE